jgi:hypothetical protein
MAPDERDRSFDKALARHLRSAAAASQAAEIPGAFASQGGACPDPETLAAYHERSLLPEQLNSLKEHLVTCANCQTVLAHLETTDEIPLHAAEEDQVFAQAASPRALSASSQTQAPSKAFPVRSRRARLLRGARWQWLAPAGAIAAGLLVWIALHENYASPLPSRPESERKMAQNKVPPASVPSLSTAVTQSSVPEKSAATLPRPHSPAGDYAISSGRGPSVTTKQSQMLSDEARARSGKSTGDKELSARKDGARDASTDQLAGANRAELDAKNLPLTMRQTVEVQSQAPASQEESTQSQNLQTPNQSNNSVSQNVRGPSPSAKAEPLKKVKRETAPPPAPPPTKPLGADGGAAASYSTSESLVVTGMISNPRFISPPGSTAIWVAGRGGQIEFSKDGGSSWSRQTSGVLADLLTGSAPSDHVCWIVGRVGAILLTTDGGTHWKIVPSPLAEDLGGVRASDAFHATIWNARSTKSFETSDGGLTWKPVPHP